MSILEVRGPRLTFRRFAVESITPEYLGWLNDPLLLQFSRQRLRRHTHESTLGYLAAVEAGGGYFWSLHVGADQHQVGTLAMQRDEFGVAEFGPLLGDPHARGIGLGREACGMALAFLFDVTEARRVTLGASAPNEPMNRCARYWGMTLEGVLRAQESIGIDPIVPVDGHFYGMLRPEWDALPHRLAITTR